MQKQDRIVARWCEKCIANWSVDKAVNFDATPRQILSRFHVLLNRLDYVR